jgi:aspartate dehydrogenase
MAKLKIGIIGCGAIGSSLAKVITRDLSKRAELAALYDIDVEKAQRLSKLISKKKNLAVFNQSQLISRSNLVIESASSVCSWDIAKVVLSKSRDIMIMSAGGIAGHFKQLSVLAKTHNSRVYIPSGAICGIDALKAAHLVKIKKVILTTRKSPRSFEGVGFIKDRGINLTKLKKDKLLFSGNAAAAVKYFPQNINVAAVLSIAGIGPHKTMVRIIASPGTERNIHEIQIDSDAGTISTRTENILHPDNPKTSYLAVLSAIATLRQILEPIRIGT